MMKMNIFTFDNLFHALSGIGISLAFAGVFWLVGIDLKWSLLAALFIGFGFYFREVLQIKGKHNRWDWLLADSLHKHLEWLAGFIPALLCAGVVSFA